MKRVKLLLIVLTTAIASNVALAWNNFGHEAIAYVAEKHLTPKAKEECRRYLNHSLPYYATWMDYYRNVGIFKPTNFWHGIKTDNNGLIDPEPRGHGAGIIQTNRIMKEMKKYKELPDSTVRQNIIYLIHMIPDMHCPVHINFPSKSFPQYRYALRNKGKKLSLHGYWDGILNYYHRKKWDARRYYNEVDNVSPKKAKAYCKGSVVRWGDDCIATAHKAYRLTPKDKEVVKISRDEREEILTFADECALKGAYRLATVLNKIFK